MELVAPPLSSGGSPIVHSPLIGKARGLFASRLLNVADVAVVPGGDSKILQ